VRRAVKKYGFTADLCFGATQLSEDVHSVYYEEMTVKLASKVPTEINLDIVYRFMDDFLCTIDVIHCVPKIGHQSHGGEKRLKIG